MTERPPVRTTRERIETVRALLASEADAWVASADARGEAYLIPLSFYWDGTALIFATPVSSRTARNLRRSGRTRIGLGPTRDVVMIDGRVEEIALDAEPALTDGFTTRSGFDPRQETSPYVLLRLTPERIQTWRTSAELGGRDVMRGGIWLTDDPNNTP